jgi:hypothetical protein
MHSRPLTKGFGEGMQQRARTSRARDLKLCSFAVIPFTEKFFGKPLQLMIESEVETPENV